MIAFDTETTGLLKPDACELHFQPQIIELYMCKFDWNGKILDEIETYIKPTLPIPEIITKITGITDQDVAKAPSFIQVQKKISDFVLGERSWFAHNCSFDTGVIACELMRHDLEMRFPWPPTQICTVEASFPIQNKRLKLGDLYRMATGKEIKNAHRAKGDVLAMVECIVWLKEKGFINAEHC